MVPKVNNSQHSLTTEQIKQIRNSRNQCTNEKFKKSLRQDYNIKINFTWNQLCKIHRSKSEDNF